MLRKGREVRSQTDYILGIDRRLFGNVSVRDPRQNSDHYMVLVCLPSTSLTEHKRYLGGRKKWPLRPLTKPTREDEAFASLQRAVPKAKAQEARRNTLISKETWRLVDERVSARQDSEKGQALNRRLGRAIKASLAADQRRRADEAGERGGDAGGGGPTPHPGGLAPDPGVVQGCGRPRSSARSSYA